MSTTLEQELSCHGYAVFRTKGISMEPLIHEDSTLVCVRAVDGPLHIGDVVLFRRWKDPRCRDWDYVLHRVERDPCGAVLTLRGDHQLWSESVPASDILGVMVGFYRGNTYIDCRTHPLYRLYTRTLLLRHSLQLLRLLLGKFRRRLKGTR